MVPRVPRVSFCWILVLSGLSLIPRDAFACSCASPTVAKSFEAAQQVFRGTVTAIRLADPNKLEGEVPTIVEFRVRHAWKGVGAQVATLHTQRNLISCTGYEFSAGVEYLVFARSNTPAESAQYGLEANQRSFGVDLCGGTKPFVLAREDELQLRKLADRR
jgi:hypothetical protein